MRVLDPTNEMNAAGISLAPRLASLQGQNDWHHHQRQGKAPRGYFTHLELLLRKELGAAQVVWREKSNYSAPADAHIVEEIPNWHAVFAGVGD